MPLYFNNVPHIELSDKSTLRNIATATVTMWVYPVAPLGNYIYIDIAYGIGGSARLEILWNNGGAFWQLGGRALDADAFSTIVTGAFANYANNWHFLACRMDYSNAFGYIDVYDEINGHTTASGAMTNMTAGNTSNTDSFRNHYVSTAGNPVSGNIDDVCIYTRLLSNNEIIDMYYKKKQPSEYLLAHRLRMKEKHPGSTATAVVDTGYLQSATSIVGGNVTYADGILP